jgi:streptogramin lyase
VTTRPSAAALAIVLSSLAWTAPAVAATGDVTEFSTGISPGAAPESITAGPDGNLWFTEPGVGKIGRITTSGVVTEFQYPDAASDPTAITAGPDGNLWFTDPGTGWIGRITATGVIDEFPLLGPYISHSLPAIAAGPDGKLWVVDDDNHVIWRVTTSGVMTHFATNPLATVHAIATGPDGNLWFPEEPAAAVGGLIARVTPAGAIMELPGGVASANPSERRGIATGPDGNLWFTERAGPRVIQVTPSGHVTEFSAGITPDGGVPTRPFGIAAGPDGNVWFTETGANQVARITPNGVVTEYATGITAGSGPEGIAVGADGALWFAERDGNRIGRINSGVGASSPAATAATALAGSPVAVDGVLGTAGAQPVPPCATGTARAWFTFVATDTTFYQVGTRGSVAPAAVCVFSGSATALTRETVDEAGAAGIPVTGRTMAGFVALAQHRYYIDVSGWPAAFHLTLQTTARPPWMQVRMTPLDEWQPDVDGQTFAWTQRASPKTFPYGNVAQPGKPVRRFATPGSYEWTVGLDQRRVVVQRADTRGHSDLLLYDLSTGRRLRLPRAVNTKGWDFGTARALSGNELVVIHGATNEKTQTLALVDLRRGRSTTLARRTKKSQPTISAASVAGRWVVAASGGGKWHVRRYDVRRRRAQTAATPSANYDYAPTILADGTVYFIRGGANCGENIRLMRWVRNGVPQVVARLPGQLDVDSIDITRIGTVTWVYAALYSCVNGGPSEDIYRFPVVLPGIGSVVSAAAKGLDAEVAAHQSVHVRDGRLGPHASGVDSERDQRNDRVVR